MLGLAQNLFSAKCNPIGIDFGSDCLRLVQVRKVDNDYKMVAAASVDVPSFVRNDEPARLAFFTRSVRDLLAQAPFKGRQVVLSMPAASMHIQHLRLPNMDADAVKREVPRYARGKIPIDPSQAMLRHVIAGEIYHEQDTKIEVIVMAAPREWVHQYLAAATKAKLDVVGMNVEPMALVDCFSHIYRRRSDQEVTRMLVDIGASGTRAIIVKAGQMLFARNIRIGGNDLNEAVSKAMKVDVDQARGLRIQTGIAEAEAEQAKAAAAAAAAAAEAEMHPAAAAAGQARGQMAAEGRGRAESSIAVMEPPTMPAPTSAEAIAHAESVANIERACEETVHRLAQELDLCRSYYETTFPTSPVDRVTFVGGEANQRGLCRRVAQELGIAAQVGDPMCRMRDRQEFQGADGIDRRQPQPAWAVAMGLSFGPM